MDTNRYIGRNNVLFDEVLPGRKGDDSWRKHTNLFFMLGSFNQCSHPYFRTIVSVSHGLMRFLFPDFCSVVQYVARASDAHAHSGSCCVTVSSVRSDNAEPRSAAHLMTSLSQIPPCLLIRSHTDSTLFPCIPGSRRSV